ncbi:MAG: hypothetical protein COU26_04065 [Candidatus Levybacteria bacterium CG10_big_fil_rev_8_21_14_0_10_36_30]|nr:MAG: hypothetical protein COU26_04065 [Candidatus Levybacteria bacterium CG10_big_fil_rev_8_21_14_0_10_36_30]
MENNIPTEQNQNPTSPVPPVVQTPPVSNPEKSLGSLEPKAKAAKLPILIIGIILFLLVAGSAAGFYIFNQQVPKQIACTMEAKVCPDGTSVGRSGPKCEFTPCPAFSTPTPTPTLEKGLHEGYGYQLILPQNYYVTKNLQSGWESFAQSLGNEDNIKSFFISWKTTDETDPCIVLPEGYPNATCTTVNSYKALDWRSHAPPYPMGPLTYTYSFIEKGIKYEIVLLSFNEQEKEQILSTFKFTDQNQTVDTSNWKTYTNSKYGYSLKYPTDKFTDCSKTYGFYLYEGKEGSRECALGEETPEFLIINTLEGTGKFQTSEYPKCYSVKEETTMIDGITATKYSNTVFNDKDLCNNMIVGGVKNEVHIVVYKNSVPYNIVFYENSLKDIKYKILSTFKFTK